MSSLNVIIMIRGGSSASVSALEKLQALALAHKTTTGHDAQDTTPSSSRQRGSASTPNMQPLDNEGIPMKTIQIRTDVI
jgi:hypothetical protein